MKKGLVLTVMLMLMLGFSAVSEAVVYEATITSDNHYGLFYGDETGVTFVGRNEFGPWGSPGSYNWSLPEVFEIDVAENDYIYIAAWSDDHIAQGVLAEFTTDAEWFADILTGTSWEYYLTDQNRDDDAAAPDETEMLGYVREAQWAPVVNVMDNGDAPWGEISDISAKADWMWGSQLLPGSGEGEVQIFRTQIRPVPEPATMALFGLGLIGLATRRKK